MIPRDCWELDPALHSFLVHSFMKHIISVDYLSTIELPIHPSILPTYPIHLVVRSFIQHVDIFFSRYSFVFKLLFFYVFIYPCIHTPFYPSTHSSAHSSTHISIYIPTIHPSVYPSIYSSIHLSTCPFIPLPIYPSSHPTNIY